MKHLKWLVGLAAMALLLSNPQAATRGAAKAMEQWYLSVAPALFPFLALMPLLSCNEAVEAYEALLGRSMGTFFNLPGAAVPGMIVGMVGGSPAGALMAREVAARSGMNRGQLQRLAMSVAGFSPAFLVGGIGAGMLGSAALGWKLLAVQVMTQMTLMILLRRAWADRTESFDAAGVPAEDQPIRGAVFGVLIICGYMTLFGALTGVLGEWIGSDLAVALACLLDVPSGASQVSQMTLPEVIKLPLLAGLCGFGGFCIVAQCLGALKGCGIRTGEYLGIRSLAGMVSAGYMALLQRLPHLEKPGLIEPIREKPLAVGGLIVSILVAPALIKQIKSVS